MKALRTARGFTLVELMVTITILAILLALAIPGFNSWIRNTRVRTTAQVIQDGLRLAQAEAVRRNRTVSFFLTNAAPPLADSTAAADGRDWGVRALPLITGESAELVRSGGVTSLAPSVSISGPAVVCFNSAGQQTANTTEGCTINAATPNATYSVEAATNPDLRLNVVASLGGRVRMCNRDLTLSATTPEGC